MISLLYENEKKCKEYDKNSIIFKDLNLDFIIEEIKKHSKEFQIEKYFYETLINKEDVLYRQEVFNDLNDSKIYDALNLFSYTMQKKIVELEDNKGTKFTVLKQIRLKQKITDYINILSKFIDNTKDLTIKSKAINKMINYISSYLNSDNIKFIINDMKIIDEEMAKVKYRLNFDNGILKIAKHENEVLVKDKISQTLDKYVLDDKLTFSLNYGQTADYILGQIYSNISKYYPDEFKHLELFDKHFINFIDETIKELVNEIQFYISYINVIRLIKPMGLEFNLPKINESEIYCIDGFDLALALTHKIRQLKVIPNSFSYKDKERIIIVSGPNQGGKTTFSRYLGQTFYLASLGLPVSGTSSSIKLVSNISTMYEVEEDSSNLNGKLKSELIRIKDIMDNIGNNGLLIMNEVFSSTSLHDGIILGKKVIDMLNKKNAYGLFVTFIEELSNYNETTVSMGSTVDKDNPSIRTFEILRRLDNSQAYAISIAKKNNVSYEDIIRRIE